MKNMKFWRTALVASLVLTVMLSVTGGTIAWFTDTVTTESNIIKSGKLDVEMTWSDTKDGVFADASMGPIFNYTLWEPGYTDVKYVEITNKGNLALQYVLRVKTDENADVKLAQVIDVYMFPGDTTPDRTMIANATSVGTLAELISDTDGAARGVILPLDGSDNVDDTQAKAINAKSGSEKVCIVLKMQENAGNEYQNLSIGNGITIQLEATQFTYEKDSFDNAYDNGAEWTESDPVVNDLPVALVSPVDMTQNWSFTKADISSAGVTVTNETITNEQIATLLSFKATESTEEVANSPYKYWNADFSISFDKDVPASVVGLVGTYQNLAFGFDIDSDLLSAIGLEDTSKIPANQSFRLLRDLYPTNYEQVCTSVKEFICGVYYDTEASDEAKQALVGTKVTVELRLYKTKDPSENGGSASPEEVSPEESVLVGKYTYTFE